MTNKERLKVIYNHFGEEDQLDKLQEEQLELLASIQDYRMNPSHDNLIAMLSEFVDVQIVMDQIKYNLPKSDTQSTNRSGTLEDYINEKCDKITERKIERTEDRIKSRYYEGEK